MATEGKSNCLIVASDPKQEQALLIWGKRFAEARGLEPELFSAQTEKEVLERIDRGDVGLLIASDDMTQDTSGASLGSRLYKNAPCATILLDLGAHDPEHYQVLVVPAVGPASGLALNLCSKMANQSPAKMVALYIEASIGKDARQAGMEELKLVLERNNIAETESIRPKVALADHVLNGIRANAQHADLILIGANTPSPIRKLRQKDLRTKREPVPPETVLGVIRGERRRKWHFMRRLEPWVPQMEFADRVDLMQRLKAGSKWNVDFILMLSLATSLASLGLLMNSFTVVIGGMLVAPLMTPIIGAGLALIQGNVRLARDAAKSIILGFLMALILSVVFGLIYPAHQLSQEILARGNPTVLDFLVAFFSGVAAAYAMARPSLLGAIAGVAVASALVPPICSVGISLAKEAFQNAQGAAVLFLTNVVAIVLGAAYIFWKMGIRGMRVEKGQQLWVRRTLQALVLIVLALGYPLWQHMIEQAEESEYTGETLTAVSEDVVEAIRERVAREQHATLIGVRRVPEMSKIDIDVVVYLAATRKVPESFADEIHKAVAKRAKKVPVIGVVMVNNQWIKVLDKEGNTLFDDKEKQKKPHEKRLNDPKNTKPLL